MTAAVHATARARLQAFLWGWYDVDRHHSLTRLAAAGLVATALLAVFGLPPVDLHAPLHYLAVMDPLCGMTRGVRLVARGDLAGAVRYNPAAPLSPSAAASSWSGPPTGTAPAAEPTCRSAGPPTLVTLVTLAVALLWARQQANADLLMHG